MKAKILLVMLLGLLLVSGNAMALPTPDGVFGSSEYSGVFAEDGVGPGGYVEPGWGGQDFDVEYLGLTYDSSNVYFGLQTGFDLANNVLNGGTWYFPGDFFFDTDNDGAFDDLGVDFSIDAANVVTLSVYQNPVVDNAGLSFPLSDPYQVYTGGGDTPEGFGTGVFAQQGASYVLEGSFALSLLGLPSVPPTMGIHWTMSCGNDLGEVYAPSTVPEPATMLLLGTGLVAFAGLGRKKLFSND